jgi:gluconolactonase
MKRILSCSLILVATLAAFACSKKDSEKPDPGTNETNTDPTQEEPAPPATEAPAPAPTGPGEGPAPSGPDPSGSPILLGAPRTVRTFVPPGGEPLFVDGPQWIAANESLFVSLPFATNLSGGKGILTTFKSDGTNYTELRAGDKVSTGVIGNSVDKDGNLISAELKYITKTNVMTRTVTVLASGYGGDGDGGPQTPFDGPNDLIALKDGSIFFTDPGYGVDPRPAVGRLFRIAADATATVTVAATYDYNPSPNGIALSKDEKTLFVGFTAPAEGTLPFVRKYTINVDGSLADMGKFVELPLGSEPDGMAVDDNDNLYIALKTGIAVFKSSGQPYGGATAKLPQTTVMGGATSLTFGGADRKSLFVTSAGKVLEFKTSVAGLLQ